MVALRTLFEKLPEYDLQVLLLPAAPVTSPSNFCTTVLKYHQINPFLPLLIYINFRTAIDYYLHYR